MSKHIHRSHNVSILLYHLVCPAKYRRAVFSAEVDTALRDVCLEIAARYDLTFLEIGTDRTRKVSAYTILTMMESDIFLKQRDEFVQKREEIGSDSCHTWHIADKAKLPVRPERKTTGPDPNPKRKMNCQDLKVVSQLMARSLEKRTQRLVLNAFSASVSLPKWHVPVLAFLAPWRLPYPD